MAAGASLLVPAASGAHALFGSDDPNRPLIEYLTLGFAHMVGGWDHLLFAAGVVILAGTLRRAAKLISLFVAGHSLTLLVATLAGWQLSATAVDIVIASSLVFIAIVGLYGQPERLHWIGAAVFGFGLVHGLGLATRLQDLGLPDDGLVIRVLLFNVGVEIGQLTALTVIVGLGTLALRFVREQGDRVKARQFVFISIAATGFVAAGLLASAAGEQAETTAGGECKVAQTRQDTGVGGGHPTQAYYGPGDPPPPEGDLQHPIGDGAVVVRYDPDLSDREHRQIERFVSAAEPGTVLAAPDPAQEDAVRALVAYRMMSCTELDVAELESFRNEWLAEIGAG